LKIFKISNGTLFNWINGKSKERKSKFTCDVRKFITNYVSGNINFNYRIIIRLVCEKFCIKISKTSIYDILKYSKIKKKKIYQRYIPDKISANLREHKVLLEKNIKNTLGTIISVDECSIDTHLTNNFGWGVRGKRIKTIHKNTRVRYTLICAIDKTKIVNYNIIKNSADAVTFTKFINETKSVSKDENINILLDNARIHHSVFLRENVKPNIKFIYNIPYMPKYNPIEQLFSKLKYLLRNEILENNNILDKIKKSLKKITQSDLNGYFRHSFNF
jgi:transposase